MSDTAQTENGDPAGSGADGSLVPPYFAFKTLLNQLDFMKEKGTPARIDRSFLIGMSGAAQSQYITGLRSLGLLDAAGVVQPKMQQLVAGSVAERKRLLADVLHERYGKAITLGETNATTGQLVELFKDEYGATGDTARKGIAFFLNAARFADVPLSPMFQTPKVSSSGSTQRKRKVRETGSLDESEDKVDTSRNPPLFADVHPALAGVLSELPRQGAGWTSARRDAFMTTFQAVVNFTIPLVEDDDEEDED